MTPDAGFVADAGLVFPVTIDPGGNFGVSYDAFVQTDYATNQEAATELKLGSYNGGGVKARSLFRFDASPFCGATIGSATVNLWETHSYSCRTAGWELWYTGWPDYSTVWSNQPPWVSRYGTSSATRGYSSSCADGWVSIPATGWLQAFADSRYVYSAFGLRAANENDSDSWKKFNSAEAAANIPHMVVSWNAAPVIGVRSTAPTTACVTGIGRPYMTSRTPRLSAQVIESRGEASDLLFEWWPTGGPAPAGSATAAGVPSGSSGSVDLPGTGPGALAEGGTYSWRVKAHDTGGQDSLWSSWCEFTVDSVKPGVPVVSSSTYPNDGAWHGQYGQAGLFTFTPAAGSSDLVGFVYQLDTAAVPTTVAATGVKTESITPPEDGTRTLRVWAKDRAGNLSDPNAYTFKVGRAGLTSPTQGANVVRRAKLAVENDPAYTRVRFQYRRGPGAVEYNLPWSNVTTAAGAAVPGGPSDTTPVRITDLGGHAVWNAIDTLGATGGVVQVRAYLFPDSDTEPGYQTQWVTLTADGDGDGAAGAEVGPGSVNLLTGDYQLSATDVDVLGLSVSRTASSREPGDGWMPQGQRLTGNQQQVSTDLTGFAYDPARAVPARVTTRGQGGTTESLEITPTASHNETFIAVGTGDYGAMRLGMQAGRRYRFTGWIYVPAGTGLTGAHPTRGLRILGMYRVGGIYSEVPSAVASFVDGWQQLSVDLAVPAGATEAFIRLYNGYTGGTGKKVYWDNLSLRELVAPFGPQWSGGPADASTGNEYTSLEFPTPDLARLNLAGGDWLTFGRSTSGGFFPEPGAEALTLTRPDASSYRLTDVDGTITEFTQQAGSTAFLVAATWTPDANSTTRYLYDLTDNRTLVTKVINPVEPGVGDCTTATPARGCQVLEYLYATATTAIAGVFGDVKDQVRQVKVWSWDPAAAAETAVVVAEYRYDEQGRLREVWDPRISPALKTAYEYDSAGRLTKVTPAGQLPWMFDFGTIGADPNGGWLHRVRRARLAQGSPTALDGEAHTRMVYRVPLSRAAGGPHNLDAAAAQTWGQKDAPTDATAIFDPEQDPLVQQATPATPGPDGYGLATVHYLNASGQQVNTATPGGYIDTRQYDQTGKVVWTLESTNRMVALGTHPDAASFAQQLNLPADSGQRAELLASTNRYSIDGIDLLESLGPVTRTALERDLVDPAGLLATIPAGSQVLGRPHTVYSYDEGKPDGASYHLVTSEASGLDLDGWTVDADLRVEQTGYAAEKGGTSGWTLKKPTKTVTDAGTGGAQVTTYRAYDPAGRVTATWGVAAIGTDARTTLDIYYTAGANPADAGCGNRPEWAGQPCLSKAAGPVTGHDPARMPGDLPVTRTAQYSRWGQPATVSETAAGKTRTTSTGHDGAGRTQSRQTSSDDGSPAPPVVTTSYHPANGQVAQTSAGGATITREYNLLGRLYRYTDADGGVTTTEYHPWGKPVKVTDNTGWTSYAYDRGIDPRGLLTATTDSIAGTFNARYSPDGQLVQLQYPGGLTRRDTLDAAFTPVARSYTRDTDGAVVYNESVVENSAGQWITHGYTGGSKTYGYDRLGRLTTVAQIDPLDQCVTRTYTFTVDNRTNRAAKQTWQPGVNGVCRSGGSPDSQQTHGYDSADRLVDAGYRYDAFGRTTVTPEATTIGYHANDLVAAQQLGDARQTWTLDPKHRFRASTTDTNIAGSWTTTSAKLNHYGDDTDEPRWIIEDTTTGTVTRNVSGPDGDLVATTTGTGDIRLQLTNLHGDIAMTIDTALTTPEAYVHDEYGIPAAGQPTQRYGWLGGKQRSAETLTGALLMGVRLYTPTLGRFLQVDPVVGGSCNAYDYTCADPANSVDLDGLRRLCRRFCLPDWREPVKRLLRRGGTNIRRGWSWLNYWHVRIFWRPVIWFVVRAGYGNNCGVHFANMRYGGLWAYGIGFAVGFIRGRPCL